MRTSLANSAVPAPTHIPIDVRALQSQDASHYYYYCYFVTVLLLSTNLIIYIRALLVLHVPPACSSQSFCAQFSRQCRLLARQSSVGLGSLPQMCHQIVSTYRHKELFLRLMWNTQNQVCPGNTSVLHLRLHD